MDFIWDSITDWLKEMLISGIVSNLSGMFDSTNEQVGSIIGQVGMTPQGWNGGIFCHDPESVQHRNPPYCRGYPGHRYDPGADSAHLRQKQSQ